MATSIIDASVALAWCFQDEMKEATDDLLRRVRFGDRCSAPAHWPTEVSNGMLVAVRRERIAPGSPDLLWDRLGVLPVAIEPPLSPNQAKAVLALSEQYQLTVYDAAYLDLAAAKVSRLQPSTPHSAVQLLFTTSRWLSESFSATTLT